MTEHATARHNARSPEAEQEFEMFVQDHARSILGYCLRRSDYFTAHDAAAEVFATAWRRFDTVPEGEAALYWLFGVARRVLANRRRSQRRWVGLASRVKAVDWGPAPTVEGLFESSEANAEVNVALRRLKSQDREILRLIVWEEVPRTEISNLLGISLAAVHKRYQRALRRVEEHLRGVEDSGVRRRDLVEKGDPA